MDLETYVTDFDRRDWQTVSDGEVRFALVGAGWWTREFVLPALSASELCTATVVVSGTPEKRRAVTDEWDAVGRGLSYDEFASGDGTADYDAVYVGTPNATHLEYVEAAADHGKDVLCEKPIEATVDRAEDLVAACDDADVTLMVGYRMHTDPAVRRARELVGNGVVGEPVLVHGQNSQRLLEVIEDPDQWRLNPDLAGYGTSVTDLGIYPLNTARFVLDADPVAVQSMMRSTHDAFDEVPDEQATFSVEYDDGTYASCTASQNAHDRTRLEVVGREGTVELDPAFHMETSLSVTRDGTTVDVEPDGVDQMHEEFDYFANQVLAGDPVYPDGEHALVDMRAIAAIHEAAESERVVRL